ncbi:hypothetical protein E2542_SST15124 [Spatholobus suberectus]|nr:hypothetical protein E2542_SST15124 [Spatholobus suberectus]
MTDYTGRSGTKMASRFPQPPPSNPSDCCRRQLLAAVFQNFPLLSSPHLPSPFSSLVISLAPTTPSTSSSILHLLQPHPPRLHLMRLCDKRELLPVHAPPSGGIRWTTSGPNHVVTRESKISPLISNCFA